MDYKILISLNTEEKLKHYQRSLIDGAMPGQRLLRCLAGHDLSTLESEDFLELLINTKIPQIFAESAIMGDGSDWNIEELSILGDVSFYVPTTIYDNGAH